MANGNGNDSGVTPHDPQPESGFSIVNAISVLIVIGFFVVLGAVQWIIPENSSAQVLSITNILIGALVASFTTVVGYHFGNSRNAKDSAVGNRETIKTLANTAATTAQTAATTAQTAATVAAGTGAGGPANPAAPPPTTTTTTTTETRVDPGAQDHPDPAAVRAEVAEKTAAAIEALDGTQGVRALDSAWAAIMPAIQANPMVQNHYEDLRNARVAALQGSDTQPKT